MPQRCRRDAAARSRGGAAHSQWSCYSTASRPASAASPRHLTSRAARRCQVRLEPKESQHVTFTLSTDDLTYVDVRLRRTLDSDVYTLRVGTPGECAAYLAAAAAAGLRGESNDPQQECHATEFASLPSLSRRLASSPRVRAVARALVSLAPAPPPTSPQVTVAGGGTIKTLPRVEEAPAPARRGRTPPIVGGDSSRGSPRVGAVPPAAPLPRANHLPAALRPAARHRAARSRLPARRRRRVRRHAAAPPLPQEARPLARRRRGEDAAARFGRRWERVRRLRHGRRGEARVAAGVGVPVLWPRPVRPARRRREGHRPVPQQLGRLAAARPAAPLQPGPAPRFASSSTGWRRWRPRLSPGAAGEAAPSR